MSDYLGQTFGITSNQVVIDMSEQVQELDANIAPFHAYLNVKLSPWDLIRLQLMDMREIVYRVQEIETAA